MLIGMIQQRQKEKLLMQKTKNIIAEAISLRKINGNVIQNRDGVTD